MRLYGLYKQAMEGDVDGVMERPSSTGSSGLDADELQREQDKWDAWNSQKGLTRTEAKRRYIEVLIDTIHRYATTPTAMELVSELEFVWNQIKQNSPGGSASSPDSATRRFQQPLSGTEGPMKVLSPMSEEDEAERESERRLGEEEDDHGEYLKKGDKWSKKMERAIVRLSTEVAALREQITSGREWRSRRERSARAWIGWFLWTLTKHIAVDTLILVILLLWMRRRKDRRLEDYVRGALSLAREYARKVLPSR
jgi:acyl-CoA-binding protein